MRGLPRRCLDRLTHLVALLRRPDRGSVSAPAAVHVPTTAEALVAYLLQLVAAIGLSAVVGSLLLLWAGANPLQVYSLLFRESFFSPRSLMISIQRATPLILTSAAATMAFQAGAINMGLVAQFSVGASAAAMAGYALPALPTVILVPLILLISGCAGAAAGFVPALVKRISGISEIVTGMITNPVVTNGLSIVIRLIPWLSSASRGASRAGIQPNARLAKFSDILPYSLGPRSEANTGIFLSITIVLMLAYWMRRSKTGYEIRMTRHNPRFAQMGGIQAGRIFFLGMMLSGAIAAMAGAIEVMGVWGSTRSGMLNVGEKDLIIALIGGQSFVGSLFAALAYGGLESGALSVAFYSTVPRPFIDILVELMVIFAALPSMRSFVSSGVSGDSDHLGGRYISEPL